MRPAAQVDVAPPAITLRALRSVLEIPLTSVAYKAAGSLAALKNLAVEMPTALAKFSCTILAPTLTRRLDRVCLDGLAPLAKSAPSNQIDEHVLEMCSSGCRRPCGRRE